MHSSGGFTYLWMQGKTLGEEKKTEVRLCMWRENQ